MMGFDKLGVYFDVHMAGIDGECFSYSVYFEDSINDEKIKDVTKAIDDFIAPYSDKDIYLGYIDVAKNNDKVEIYLDLGNVQPDYEDTSIKGILKALNNVSRIKSVIVNEGCEFDF